MKKINCSIHFSLRIWSILLLVLVFCLNVNAQNRKKKVTRKPVKTTVVKPVAKVNKNCAIYSWEKDVRSVRVTKDYIYYVEVNDNNAVMAIDRKTGDIKTIIPGIAGIYEGARPRIYSIFVCGDRLIFQLLNPHGMSNECGGVYVFDGKSVETSLYLKTGTIIDGNDNYLFTIDCGNWQKDVIWDAKTLKPIKRMDHNSILIPNKGNLGFIASNGSVWGKDFGVGGITCYALNGKSINYTLDKEAYVIQEMRRGTYGGQVLNTERIQQAGDYIYATCKRRIYRMNLLSPGKWEEYAKMPANINNTFDWFCADAQGNLLTRGDSHENNNTLYWKVGSFDSPQPIGRDIETGFTEWGYTRIWENLNTNFMDADGNLVSHSGSSIYIYNPNGVVGYTNTVGRIVKL